MAVPRYVPLLAAVAAAALLGLAAGDVREKRTLDFVLRSVAEVFGYDVQKRPSVLPLMAATTAAPPAPSTFFPPPLKPLPLVPIPRIFPVVTVKLTPAQLIPAKPLPIPRAGPGAPQRPPKPPVVAPPKPPVVAPKPAPAPPKPPAPPAATPQPVTAPPLLTENTQAPPAAAAKPAAPAPQKPPVPAPAPAPPPPPKPQPPPPPTAAPPPPLSPAPPKRRPELYANYPEYYDAKEKYQEEAEPANYDYDLTNENYAAKPAAAENQYEDNKQRFKESVQAFWAGSPWIQNQHGYKYLTPPSQPAPPVRVQQQGYPPQPNYQNPPPALHYPPSAPTPDYVPYPPLPPTAKYEEYPLPPPAAKYQQYPPPPRPPAKYVQYQPPANEQYRQQQPPPTADHQQQKYEEYDAQNEAELDDPESEKYVDYDEEELQPQNEQEEYFIRTTKDKDSGPVVVEQHYVRNPQQEESGRRESYVKASAQKPPKKYPCRSNKVVTPSVTDAKKPRQPPKTAVDTAVVPPKFSGVLPVSLHQLYDKGKSPWPLPFDADYASSMHEEVVKKLDSEIGFAYVPERYSSDHSWSPPEPQPMNYGKLEKLTRYEDSDSELSKNARIQTTQSGKKVTLVRVNKGETKLIR